MPDKAPAGNKPRLLIISAILPFPPTSGQRVRVLNKIIALRPYFHITFLGLARSEQLAESQETLAQLVDKAIILPMRSQQGVGNYLWCVAWSYTQAIYSGLRASNHLIGDFELSPERIKGQCDPASFDLVLYEYWHTHNSLALFKKNNIPCVLDMHDLCWRVVARRLQHWAVPAGLRHWRVMAYRQQEEAAWDKYDLLITINREETAYVQRTWPNKPIIYAPMGIDAEHQWAYDWRPADPPRLAFYGALGSLGNRLGVARCLEQIMPLVWEQRPEAEFWIVGGNPSAEIRQMAQRPRVHVTGFVPNVAETLASMTLVLCPWQGTFGFRSRVVEVMALGLPVVATADAVFGMGLQAGQGLLLAEDDRGLADHCLVLLHDPAGAKQHSLFARQQVVDQYSFSATYGYLASQLYQYAQTK